MKKKWLYMCFMLTMILPACKKFLDINKGTNLDRTPQTVQDFALMLNNPALCQTQFHFLPAVTDDFYSAGSGSIRAKAFYLWEKNLWETARYEDLMYNGCYKWIAQMNLVINSMPTALPAGEMNDERALAIAEAKINRAYFYLQLVNIYGPAYQSASARTDLAVPLILQANNQVSQARANVEQIYEQILADLEAALATPQLKDKGINIIHPGRAAVFALLARTYLYMGNYTQAEKAASAALAINSRLTDYRSFKAPEANDGRTVTLLELEKNNNVEVLLARVSTIEDFSFKVFGEFIPTQELLSMFDKNNDKRYTASFAKDSFSNALIYRFGLRATSHNLDNGIAVPEIMLIKAECLARANDATGAINLLNTLRSQRIVNYTNLPTNVNAEDALRQVLDERRRELMFKGGIRLFDLKRLNLEQKFKKDIVRRDDNNNYLVTLPAGSPNYVFSFSRATMNANSLLVQNPRVQLQ